LTEPLTPGRFRDRYALAAFADGGVVVDLETGSYSALNGTAAAMLTVLQTASSADEAVDRLAARFGISAERARADLAGLTEALSREGLRIEPIDAFRYRQAEDGGYDLWHGERRTVHLTPDLRRVTLGQRRDELPLEVYEYVSDLAPKVMFLLGIPVLHGSTWQRSAGVLAMCGKSKAGKTTTARTLARHAGRVLSEDLITLRLEDGKPCVFVEAEANIVRWSRAAAQALNAGAASVDTRGLVEAATGPTAELTSLWFLDARRRGERFLISPISKAAALTQLLSHGFLGGAGDAHWRRFLETCRTITAAVAAHEASLPSGLDRLDAALADFAKR
jgi:hypothetical protein